MSDITRSSKRARTEEEEDTLMERQIPPAPLPYADTVEQFLLHPLEFAPKPIFLAQPYQNVSIVYNPYVYTFFYNGHFCLFSPLGRRKRSHLCREEPKRRCGRSSNSTWGQCEYSKC